MYFTGFPRSGKNQWKMKKVQGQGKVREFWVESGKFEILEKVREIYNNNLSYFWMLIITVQLSRSMCPNFQTKYDIQNTAVIIFGEDSERIAHFLPIGFKWLEKNLITKYN